MLPLLVLVGTIAGAWYLLIVRPQRDQQSRHGQLVERLTVGDHVLTVGGIYGRVAAVEGTSVVLELAPGLTSRIATAGIARIVHGAEAALPTDMNEGSPPPAVMTTPRSASDTHMQHEQHPQHQHAPQQPALSLPQQPFAAAPTMHMPVAQPQVVAPVPQPQQQPPLPTTFRAQVLPALPTFEPRPWGDAAPIGHAPVQAPPMQHVHAPTLPPAPQLAAPVVVHTPFAPPAPPAQHYAVPQPQQYAMPQPAMPQYATQPQYAASQPLHYAAPPQPQHYAAPPSLAPAPVVAHQPVVAEPEDQRRHSRAPQGMGSTLRLDDPSLTDTIARARGERSVLADEYRKLTAPLVDVHEQHPTVATHLGQPQPHAEPQFVGHDPSGVPLFAMPGGHVVAGAPQYPGPARPETVEHGMPRPVFAEQQGAPDPAFANVAFQRRAPYAPQPAAGTPTPA